MISQDKEQLASELRGSLLLFIRFFFKIVTGREFTISHPIGRESHHVIICRAYTELTRVQKSAHGLLVNVPPGYGKSVISSMFVAWCFANYDKCNFMYISYSHDLASKHTAFIKMVMSCHQYKFLFGVEIRADSRAKDHFVTSGNGEVSAFGSSGAITGRNAGLPNEKVFTGCVIIDDAHKPDEVHSDTIRASVIRNYQETILQRPRDVKVPILFIGQRLHEDDLAAYLMSGKDVRTWDEIILPGIDVAGNALYPEAQPLEYLRELQEKQPYTFSSQIQQEPIPAGGSLFKPEWFFEMDEEPEALATYITCDTAETDKTYNDASAFSFWSVYELKREGRGTGQLGIHWLDTLETRVEPKDLEATFMDFYSECNRHKCPPFIAAIEKKSTGVTLVSVLKSLRGLTIREIDRTRASGCKTQRFLDIQSIVASQRVSYTKGARHIDMCLTHMSKITANNTHRHDDIADTMADAVRLALIDKTVYSFQKEDKKQDAVLDKLGQSIQARLRVGRYRYHGNSS